MIPHDIFTWTTKEQGQALHDLAKGKNCLEVGAWVGFTTVCMAQTANLVYSIDVHVGDIHTGRTLTLPTYLDNLKKYRVMDNVAILVGESVDILPKLPKDYFDLAFIDATHTYEAAKKDTELTWPLMRRGGYVTFHDYEPGRPTTSDWGVTAAVDECIERYKLERIDTVGTLLICKVPSLS